MKLRPLTPIVKPLPITVYTFFIFKGLTVGYGTVLPPPYASGMRGHEFSRFQLFKILINSNIRANFVII